MVKFGLKVVLVASLAVLGASTAQAAEGDRPLLSMDRLSLAGGVNHVWHAAPAEDSTPLPLAVREWEAGLYAAYNLTPRLSLVGSTVYGFDNKLVESRAGLRVRFTRVAE